MQLVRGYQNLQPDHRGCVATIGNFDGVHLGHRAILEQLKARAQSMGLPATAIIFEPQPAEYFAPGSVPTRLMWLREKLFALERCGVDRVLCLRFGPKLANMKAEDFIHRVLVQGLGIRYLSVGDDFHFGARRRGNFDMLVQAGRRFGFEVQDTPTIEIDGDRVSSTRIRLALGTGDLALAERLLGHRYSICGRVVRGDQIGRTLGYPTANVYVHRHVLPVHGVFAVTVRGIDPQPRPGVANVGTRPTVGGIRHQLEVHLFDFDGDLYGRHLQVFLERHIRAERKFESFEALKDQIHEDARAARQWCGALADRRAGS